MSTILYPDFGPGEEHGYASPTWTLPIKVVDSVEHTYNKRALRTDWAKARDRALLDWSEGTDLTFTVELGDFPIVTDISDINLNPQEAIIGDAMHLMRMRKGAYSADGVAFYGETTWGFLTPPTRWGFVLYRPDQNDVRPYFSGYRPTITHELGHLLGFAHGGVDSNGVMLGFGKVSDVEREKVNAYYG